MPATPPSSPFRTVSRWITRDYSGHGTSRHDPKLGLPVPHGSGALTAWDSSPEGTVAQVMGSLIVGRTDLKPRLQRLDQGGRHVFVVLDACYSANATRGLYRSLTGTTAAALQEPLRKLPRGELGQ